MPDRLNAALQWHEAWQAAAMRAHTEAAARGDFARIPDIGRAALSRTPMPDRESVMDVLFEAYWNNRVDWDIRRLLEEGGSLAASGAAALRNAVQDANDAGEGTVTVSRDQLALLLEDWQAACLHRRDCTALNDG